MSEVIRRIALAQVCLAAGLLSPAIPAAEFAPIANPGFDQGNDAPTGWTLSGGKGRWADRRMLEVTGDGADSNHWRCDYRFTRGGLHHFTVVARHTGGSGCVVAGPAFANRDYRLPEEWSRRDYFFRVPDNVEESYFRLGQWQATGNVQFREVDFRPSIPVHTAIGGLLLGEGESIRDGRYTFSGTFAHQGSNYHRTLYSTTTGFNSDRWTFGGNAQVTYRFNLPGHEFLSGDVSFNVNHYTRGACAAEISRDQTNWRPLTTQDKLGTSTAKLPDNMLPAETLYLRLKSASPSSSFQVNHIELTAQLSGAPPDAVGETTFADIEVSRPGIAIEQLSLQQSDPPGNKALLLTTKNTGSISKWVGLGTIVTTSEQHGTLAHKPKAELASGESATLTLPLSLKNAGDYDLQLVLTGSGPDGGEVQAGMKLSIPDYYRSDYGKRIAATNEKAGLWWCDATRKIPRGRPLPGSSSPAVQLSAAGNDFEAVQVVVLPREELKGLTARAGSLAGPGGATIPPDNIKILRVAYHFAHHPTDKTGIRDFWPDALPPLAKPIDLPAGKNQPLWVLVHVPSDAKPGDYSGRLSLKAEGFSADVPLKLHVWGFSLPERNHLETAFGLSTGNIFRYHALKTEADKRRVLEMYFQSFADHRISPYNPAPLDPIRVEFLSNEKPPRADVDFSAFDPAMTRAVEKFNFTGLRLPIQGMGGGTFHSRVDPKIDSFSEETFQYQTMFSSYVKQLEGHFREKGWLKAAYIYWFDEPAPKDYEFVANGMKRLKKYAPGLQRMLTEQPDDSPLIGTVDIWCPVSFNYEHEAAEKRRAHGERFWWYVCCGPKEPYCTLFIDHPATELRTWLWQTWQRDISGILVWSSNYWTSSAAFPDPEQPQNPYADPMGYVSGYSTPKGTKRYWGNGDGRFIYPPESAAVPGKSGVEPVIEPPVSSIRWEMLREGIEDYEMLYMLRELLDKRCAALTPEQIEEYESLLEVPATITSDMTTFTTDPTPIYARRSEVAAAIECLGKH